MSAVIYYDGECSFCRSYIAYSRLKQRFGEISLVDARTAPEKTAEFLDKGYDIDDGFIVEAGGRIYFGAEAMALINSELAPRSTGLRLLSGRRLLKIGYPIMRSIRNFTLRLLGRSKINAETRRRGRPGLRETLASEDPNG